MAKESKKNFVLRLDEATYKYLERWAADEFRSVNGQIEFLLNQALKHAGRKSPNESNDLSPEEKTN